MQLSRFSLAVLVLASAAVALRPKLLPEFDRAARTGAANRRRQIRSRGSPPEPRISSYSRKRTIPEPDDFPDLDEDDENEEIYSRQMHEIDDDDQKIDVAMDETDPTGDQALARYQKARQRRAFGKNDYLLPENFRSLRRKDIPVTYRLHDDLLRYYRKGTRPVTHPNKIVSVQMTTFLYQIIKLDAVQNTISLSGSFELYWQDEFLQWQPDAYQGATEIFLASTDIWIPEFSLYYSLNFDDAVKLQSNNDVRVNYTGHVRYYIPFSTESLCKLDVKFFPFDIQQCTLLFGSWAHSNDSIKYSLYSKNLSLIDFYDNQEWQLDLEHSHIMSDGFLYDYLDPPLYWEMVIIDLVVIRQSFYYVFNLVIPSTIITLVAVIGFHTPSTSGRMRDAKFRLGIMSLMSTSVILLAIVEVMPKFSMSSSRKGRGSFSGIPLIGLYYFILLAIIGLSTVTTSMFVFLERDLREKHTIPWFLRWLGYDLQPKALRRSSYRRARGNGSETADALLGSGQTGGNGTPHHQHLNGFVGDGVHQTNSVKKVKSYAQSMALSLMRHMPKSDHHTNTENLCNAGQQTASHDHPNAVQENLAFDQSPRQNLRRRLSLAQYDNMLIYQYFNQLLEDAMSCLQKIDTSVNGIRHELASMKPDHSADKKWYAVIRRLELMSLVFYVSLLFTTMFLFFNHSWYCSVGASVCGQQNLKCPWMPSNPSDPSCQA